MKKNLSQIFVLVIVGFVAFFYYLQQKITISVIIPIYNAEKYLSRCLDSVVSQADDLEIIAINDGSTDSSLQILQDYAKKYPNIKIITQTNQGVAKARNVGIQNSTTDYITFIDSDDWLEPNTINKALSTIKKDSSDIILTSYYDVYDKEWVKNIRGAKDAEQIKEPVKYQSHSLDKLSLYSPFYAMDSLSDLYYIGGGVRGRFFNTEFVKQYNITFPDSLQCYEDDVFLIKAFAYNPKISIIKDALYNYLNRQDSISKSQNTLVCGKKSWEIMSQTKEYQKFTRNQKNLIKDLFISYLFLSIANFEHHNIPLDSVIKEAKEVYLSFNTLNSKELATLRNYQKLYRILYN